MIPKIIHQIWVGSDIPSELLEYTKTWSVQHPAWKHVLWADAKHPPVQGVEIRSIEPRLNKALYEAAEELAPNNVGQFKADILRYELLFFHGGVYVDLDFECYKPLDVLLERVGCFAAWESQGEWINNAIMGSHVGHPFMEQLCDGLPRSVEKYKGSRPNKVSGPQYLTRMYQELSPDMTIFDKRLFYPYLWNELHLGGRRFPNAFAVHHWWNKRVNNPRRSGRRASKV